MLRPLPKNTRLDIPEAEVVNRERLDTAARLWDEALAATLPEPETAPAVEHAFYHLGEALTAPEVSVSAVEPVTVVDHPGFNPYPVPHILTALGDALEAAIGLSVPALPPDFVLQGPHPPVRAYSFSVPVNHVERVRGRLERAVGSRTRLGWGGGTPATTIVETLDLSGPVGSEVTAEFQCVIDGDTATWTLVED